MTAPVTTEDGAVAVAPWRRLTTVPELDGVRGLAVVMIVVTHLQVLVPYGVTKNQTLDRGIDGMFVSVDLFFVLSGFLITSLLLDESRHTRTLRFGAFYARRALRLLPALYVLLAAHAIYAWLADLSSLQEWATVRSAALYVSNWQLVFRPLTAVPDLGLLWTLAIEEQFYLLWPAVLILFLSPRESALKVSAIIGAGIIAVAVWRAHLWETGVFWAQLSVRTDTRLDSLLVGALLASLWARGKMPRSGSSVAAWVGLAVFVGSMFAFDITGGGPYKGGHTLIAFACAAIVWGLLEGQWWGRHLFGSAPLRLMGRVSYSLYLWHFPVFYVVAVQGAQWTNAERLLVALPLTGLAVVASWNLIEKPALRLKSRFRVTRAPRHDTVAVVPLAPPPRPPRPQLSRTGKVGLVVAALLATAVLLRFTVFVGDPTQVDGVPQTEGLRFPPGDVDRVGFWALVGLEATFQDAFDRGDGDDLGSPWEEVTGDWRLLDEAAVSTGEPIAGTRIAVAPQVTNDGLVEVTLRAAAGGTGLVFRYEDAANWWAVRPADDRLGWEVIQMIDGQRSAAGEFSGPVYNGVTISVTQSSGTIRFLLEGVEYYRLLHPAPQRPVRAGLVADGAEASAGQWDRFLIMADRAATGG